MNTKQISIQTWSAADQSQNLLSRVYFSFISYADGQVQNQTLWFFLALMIHGVFFLASPAILIGFFGAPILVLAITIINFFANLIANMGGAGIRTTLILFYSGLVVNLSMIAMYVL